MAGSSANASSNISTHLGISDSSQGSILKLGEIMLGEEESDQSQQGGAFSSVDTILKIKS